MATPNDIRADLQTWIMGHLRVDEWTPTLPKPVANATKPSSAGVVDASQNIVLLNDDDLEPTGQITVTFQVIYAYPASNALGDLPISEAEQYLLNLQHGLSKTVQRRQISRDVLSVNTNGNIIVGQPIEENNFWTIIFELTATVEFKIKPDELSFRPADFAP